MRNPLILLSSLALASIAGAQSSSTSTATTHVSYEATSNVRLLSLVGEQYSLHTDGSAGIVGDNAGGTAQLGHSEATTHAYDAATNAFDLGSTVTATLDSADYSAVPHIFPDGPYQIAFTGYRYFLHLYNTTDQPATITFHVSLSQTLTGGGASPYGLSVANPDGSYTPGAFADGSATGGLTNRSTEDQFGAPPNLRGNYDTTSYIDQPGVVTPTYSLSKSYGYDATYTLARGQIHTFQLVASTSASAQFIATPVPEPASLAALGAGALTLIRRRRHA